MAIASKPKAKPLVHHKKRTAQHHRQSKHYLQTYWPYIPMLLIVASGFSVSHIWDKHAVLGASTDFSSQSLLQDTNSNRSTAHEPALTIDPKLQAAAQAKASDMVMHNYWAHISPNGTAPWTLITDNGYNYQAAGENLAYGFDSAATVEAGWMNSPEHRANVLNAKYQNVGFGVATALNFLNGGPATIIVAEYAQPVADVANVTFTVAPPSQVKGESVVSVKTEPSAQSVSHLQLVAGTHSWLVVAVSAITGAAIMLFVIRHGLRIRKMVSKGELYIIHHPYLDIGFVLIATIGVVLTRSSGIIR